MSHSTLNPRKTPISLATEVPRLRLALPLPPHWPPAPADVRGRPAGSERREDLPELLIFVTGAQHAAPQRVTLYRVLPKSEGITRKSVVVKVLRSSAIPQA